MNSVVWFRQAAENMSIAGHALRLDTPLFQSLEQRAARFAIMLAVAETAVPEQLLEFDEARFHIGTADVAEAEFANAG